MMTLHKKALLALLVAFSLPLIPGCKDLGGKGATDSDVDQVSGDETTVAEPAFEPIRINSAPTDLVGYAGQSATFSVTASSGSKLSYQWFHNGSPIAGATSASLSFVIAGTADAGTYKVKVSNSSTETSSAAKLYVNELPEITGEPQDVTIYPGETAVFSVDATGDNIEYQWQARSLTGWKTLDTTTDTLVVENVDTSTTKQYRVKVKNDGGQKTSRTSRINLKSVISIATQPADQLVAAGDNASFAVEASGYGTLSYQWLKAGSPISDGSKFQGANTARLSVLNVSPADANLYSVVIVNGDGITASSNSAALSLIGPAVVTVNPKDTTLYTGQSGALKIAASGDAPISYQWQKLSGSTWQNLSGATSAQLSFSSVSSGTAGQYRCVVSNAGASDVSNSAAVTVLNSATLTQSPQSQTAQVGDSVTFKVSASGDNLQYEWSKNGQVITGSGDTLSFASVRELDEATYSCRVFNAGSSARCSSFSLNILSPISIIKQPVSQTTYEGGSVSLSVDAGGDPTPSVEWYHNNALVGTGNTLALNNITLDQAGDYQCLVKNELGSLECDVATVTVSQSVTILNQPKDTTVNEGSDLTLTVQATGENLTYKWLKDGTNLINNAAVLTLTNLTSEDTGTYSCRVWNNNSSAVCADFTVSVNGKITILQQPQAARAYEDDTISLTVGHSGGSDTRVQWYHNGSVLADTGNTLTLSPLVMSQAGDYHCVVSNSVNSVTCDTIAVEVLEKVRITKQPSNQILQLGGNIVLDVEASGALPITYQCYKDNTLLITTNSVTDLVIPSGTATDSGSYYCVVSNEGSSATSNVADITILADATGSVMLSWNVPQYRANGETLAKGDIQGYNIYVSNQLEGSYDQVKSTSTTSAQVTGLAPGVYYFRLTTVDNSGLESTMSSPVPITIL